MQKRLESQHEQIKLYEKKLKDVVRAYKSLDAEKVALQKALDSLSPERAADGVENPETEEDTIASLKAAIGTLTRENSRKEAAFQNDKKALLNENASLKEQLKKLSERLANAEKNCKTLQAKLQQVDVDREKELFDHGKVLAEMQVRYAKEHQTLEAATKETSALTKQITQKDELINQLKSREAQLGCQVAALNIEVKELTEKAYHVPSIQILKDEMANLKVDHARELVDAVVKTKHRTQQEEQDRASSKIAELEEKMMNLLQAVAKSEAARSEAHEAFLQSEMEKASLFEELVQLRSRYNDFDECRPSSDVVARLRSVIAEVRETKPEFDISAFIGPDHARIQLQNEYGALKEEYNRCRSRLEILSATSAQFALNSDCTKEETLRVVAEQFQDKIQKLVAMHAKDRALHEKATHDLHARISELEQREGRLVVEMRREMNNRISEMEAEMQKQRNRTIDVVAEKERELEAAKSALLSFRNEQPNAPADPSQAGKAILSKRRSSEYKRYADRRFSTGSRKSVDGGCAHSVEVNAGTDGIPIPGANESRNIFYEEELLKKDREIQEMRSLSHQLDYRLREVEQAALVKELEHHKKTASLTEEISKLQDKLSLLSAGGEMEYLRNIFIQFIQSSNSSAKRNILKAMGMALRVSVNEMKSLESK